MPALSGLTVIVTRPKPQGLSLCQAIASAGARVHHFPTLAFAAPADQSAYQQALSVLAQQDWLIFISPQAVYALEATLKKMQAMWPPQLQLAAVGDGTAALLQKTGFFNVLTPTSAWNSESLLALKEWQAPLTKKIAIVRGAGGRELLDATLAARGAEVLPVIAYQRICPAYAENELAFLADIAIAKDKTLVIASSYESVKNWKMLAGSKWWQTIQSLPLIVPSVRIKTLAEDLDFQTIWVADNLSEPIMLAKLTEFKNSYDK